MKSECRCANCDWWELEDAIGDSPFRRAKCLRVLPRVASAESVDYHGVWPETMEHHRCWQWAAKPAEVTEEDLKRMGGHSPQ